MGRLSGLLLGVLVVVVTGCTSALPRAGGSPSPTRTTATTSRGPSSTPSPSRTPSPTATPIPTPPLPPYYIESLRAQRREGAMLSIGDDVSCRGYSLCLPGVHTKRMSWPSGGQTMTGLISLPDGPGPFPVVVVNHGFIPPERYSEGQDSLIFGEPMAQHGFIAVAPHWPGYLGSGPAPPELPALIGEAVAALDLVGSLASLPQADTGKIAFVGHSNGGGESLIAMVADPRIKAVVLHGPVSSDMRDNARKWWLARPGSLGALGTPESNPAGYDHISPRNYFQAGQPPVLIIQGTADHTIPREWTEATLAALKEKGVPSDVKWFPGADHDFGGADLSNAVAAQEAWIRKVLGI